MQNSTSHVRNLLLASTLLVASAARHNLQTAYRPQVLYAGGTDEALPALEHRQLGGLNIFVCEDGTCDLPVTSAEAAVQAMAARRR